MDIDRIAKRFGPMVERGPRAAARGGLRVLPGAPWPLGANWDGSGVNFALFSEHATAVDLCLFDAPQDQSEGERIRLTERDGGIWHCYLPDVRPGQLYGYRVHGPWRPEEGLRFNAHKLLLDPYAMTIGRQPVWNDALFGYQLGHPDADLAPDERDSAPWAPLGMVVDPAFTWGDDRPPRTPWERTVIYEVHPKGFTVRNEALPERLRGTYAGLATAPVIDYLKTLGVTAIELLPVHHHLDQRYLEEKGLTNYWGYDTLAYFAPDLRYASTRNPANAVREFKMMVRALHAAGIEVILDVVYNHTAEGNHLGPTLSLRGIDNLSYYRTVPDNPRYYMDFTGTGNTLNAQHPRTLQLIMDSLRYWVNEMHVDGFRFDLASALARGLFEVDRLSAFFEIIMQDPVLSRVKLIAEPWDVGEGGYQVGNFPVGWAEWNGKYRDTVRRFWRGEFGTMSDVATRIAGSSDLYEASGRLPFASINFVTAHDGFTLRDLVSFDHKHNEANGEENRDGADDNESWNMGVEGETDDPGILTARRRRMRSLLTTLFVSQGVPMLLGGDEIGRTQRGNNNGYCQDNEISWYDWNLEDWQIEQLEFTRKLIKLRQEQPVLGRRRFFQGRPIRGADIADIGWFVPDGHEIDEPHWNESWRRSFGLRLAGDAIAECDRHGRPVVGDTLMILFNAWQDPVDFKLPKDPRGRPWEPLLDTADVDPPPEGEKPHRRLRGNTYHLEGWSTAILRLVDERARKPHG